MMVSRLKSWGKSYGGCLLGIALVAYLSWGARHVGETSWLKSIGVAALAILGFLLIVFLLNIFGAAFSGDSVSGSKEPFFSYGGESYSLEVDFSSPLNRGVLDYLKRSRPNRTAEWESVSPLSLENPIRWTGTHTEIGVRLWSDLAASLPAGVECRWIVLGVPALVHPETGVLFGIAFDTTYALRLTDADMESALKAEASVDGWSDIKTPKLASELGPGWVFGSWQIAELAWCRAAYDALGAAAGDAAPEQRA